MSVLSEDDLNPRDLSDDELVRAWDLWCDLAQVTNDSDPAYTHGVFIGVEPSALPGSANRVSGLDVLHSPAPSPGHRRRRQSSRVSGRDG